MKHFIDLPHSATLLIKSFLTLLTPVRMYACLSWYFGHLHNGKNIHFQLKSDILVCGNRWEHLHYTEKNTFFLGPYVLFNFEEGDVYTNM